MNQAEFLPGLLEMNREGNTIESDRWIEFYSGDKKKIDNTGNTDHATGLNDMLGT